MNSREGLPYVDLDPDIAAIFDAEREERQPKRRRGQRDYVQVPLTDDLVRAVRPGAREEWVRDEIAPYLALRIQPAGSMSWYYLYSDRDEGRSERQALGSVSNYTVSEARRKAEWAFQGHSGIPRPLKLRRDTRIEDALKLYFAQHGPADSDWFKLMERMFTQYLVPRFGTRPLSALDRDQWLLLVEKIAADRSTRGTNFLKGAKAFLSWAVERGLLQGNPLAKVKLDLPSVRKAQFLSVDEIRAIYDAAQKFGHPWAAMVGLVILTGEHIEDVRQIKHEAILWNKAVWCVEYDSWRGPSMATSRKIDMPPEAMALIEPYRGTQGHFFASPRSGLWSKPINFYTEINEKLRDASGVIKPWGARDLWLSVHQEARRLKKGPDMWTRWAAWIASGRHPNWEDLDVEL